MTNPVDDTIPTTKKRKGPRSFKGESFALKYNATSLEYEMIFDGIHFPIRFVMPEGLKGLVTEIPNISYKSGRYQFTLNFTKGKLSSITNETIRAQLKDGEVLAPTDYIQVPFDHELAGWIRVLREVTPVQAARLASRTE